ncbi:hypothetical protein LPB72_00840 [Hydrogenophaga crassostreae]|uniref:DUF4123 domain-containing protein n=1 Tax=Hydrogenophaga crassostreae TaxID=1763535 RepID=A0A170AJ97_9BURK|nr:hypothetical protein [Hydrogenophaga crassostreae]AOW13947.1 hypothetical protein LPB072_14975 [Hydrogenophaga crassostreae]OAD44088.1 hypothetical protein LPB72_00840 [Hydrogenophaga crassostreae]
MTPRLSAEIQRLYRSPGAMNAPGEATLGLVDSDGRVRAMVVSLSGPADWSLLSAVWRGVQIDLELPAPAIAVNGLDAYELWFSLAVPVPQAQALAFLQGLRQRYLPDVKPHRVGLRPSHDGVASTAVIPAAQGDSGNWSAFVAPDLAAVFGDEPLLDLPPGEDAQAELLGRLKCIVPSAFEAALGQLPVAAHALAPDVSGPASVAHGPSVKARYEDPRLFLQDIMNDASVPVASRIEAARALLGC